MNRKLIARQLILEAKKLLAAGKKDSDYVYDPDHKHKPKGGHWEKTEKGWSQKKKEKKEKKLRTKEQENIAENPNTPVDTLVELSKDDNHPIKFSIAGNPNTPVDRLVELSKDKSNGTRAEVAKNPNTPEDTLIKLSKDKEEFVRGRVTVNPNTPVDTLVELSKDEDSWIRKKAQEELQKRKSIENAPIDFSKLSPELREQVKDMDPEELKEFIGWLKERKG